MHDTDASPAATASGTPHEIYVPPIFEVIALDCEITSYAPDADEPLV